MTTISPRQQKDHESVNKLNTMMMDGNDFDKTERFYEDMEYDDGSAVDYDLDFTTQS